MISFIQDLACGWLFKTETQGPETFVILRLSRKVVNEIANLVAAADVLATKRHKRETDFSFATYVPFVAKYFVCW